MNCEHPWWALLYNSDTDPLRRWVECAKCGGHVVGLPADRSRSREVFNELVNDKFSEQTNRHPRNAPFLDMFGNEILVGSHVAYPTMSGRSVQMSHGVVLEINPPTKAVSYGNSSNKRIGEPDRLKVRPTGITSRWSRFWMSELKPVTLSANAASVVVIYP